MKIYKDPTMTEEVIDILDLGIVPAGESKEYTFHIYNDDTCTLVDLEFIVEHKEVEVLNYPKMLNALALGELKIKWSPSITLKQGLKASLSISGNELWS